MGWKRLYQPVSCGALYLTADETARGYVVFTRDYTEKVYPFTHPQRDDIDRPLTAFATPGEFEPATAAIYAVGNLGAVDVSVSDFTSADGGLIPSEQVDVGIVRCWRQRAGTGRGPSGYFTVEPELIEPAEGRMRRVSGGVTKQWWFTVRVPRNADPGRYTARVTFSPENASPVEVEWRLLPAQ